MASCVFGGRLGHSFHLQGEAEGPFQRQRPWKAANWSQELRISFAGSPKPNQSAWCPCTHGHQPTHVTNTADAQSEGLCTVWLSRSRTSQAAGSSGPCLGRRLCRVRRRSGSGANPRADLQALESALGHPPVPCPCPSCQCELQGKGGSGDKSVKLKTIGKHRKAEARPQRSSV